MRARYTAFSFTDPRDGRVFFVGSGRPTRPAALVEAVRRWVRSGRPAMRQGYTDRLRVVRIADILEAGHRPVVRVLHDGESRTLALAEAERARLTLGLDGAAGRRREPSRAVGAIVTAKGILLVEILTGGPGYATELVDRLHASFGIDFVYHAVRDALEALECAGCLEAHQRPAGSMRGRPRIWYLLTERGRREAEKARAVYARIGAAA